MEQTSFMIESGEDEGKITFMKALSSDIMSDLCEITNNEGFYNDSCTVTIDYLYKFHQQMQERVAAGNTNLLDLTFYLSDKFKDKLQQYDRMSEDGKVTFENLSNVFRVGNHIVGKGYTGELIGSVIHDTSTRMMGQGIQVFVIEGMMTHSNGKNFVQLQESFYIPQFGGLRRVEDLDVRPMTDEDRAFLTERGRKFRKYGLGCKYAHFTGEMFKKGMYGPVYFKADGRVMVDAIGYKNNNPNSNRQLYHMGGKYGNEETKCEDIPDDLLFMTSPTLLGFCFATKDWGEIPVDGLDDIEFDDDAIDLLVVEPKLKSLLVDMVTHSDVGFNDIITGKSGGCIVMLEGPPGIGKTLTCEVIAEKLHKPLYSVSVGELGVTPKELSHKLGQIQEIVESWDAVLLLDEADIFMEKRVEKDIVRNAMVGIFLTMLDKYKGVMFLTTNRIGSIDHAFNSRILMNLDYKNLEKEQRLKVWENLLKSAGMSDIIDDPNFANLADLPINGRQIKNLIRMTQRVNHARGCTTNVEGIIEHAHLSIRELRYESFKKLAEDK